MNSGTCTDQCDERATRSEVKKEMRGEEEDGNRCRWIPARPGSRSCVHSSSNGLLDQRIDRQNNTRVGGDTERMAAKPERSKHENKKDHIGKGSTQKWKLTLTLQLSLEQGKVLFWCTYVGVDESIGSRKQFVDNAMDNANATQR